MKLLAQWTRRSAVKAQEIVWIERVAGSSPPEVGSQLSGWTIEKRRPSHLNARRSEGDVTYFLKWFFHSRWAHPARKEWRNSIVLRDLGIPTVKAVGWGRHLKGSFVVLEGSRGFSLEQWRTNGLTEEDLVKIAGDLAHLAARLHSAGWCHKDLNVYHVIVSSGGIRLIDVGRVSRFHHGRWIVKDLASLLASARREHVPMSAGRAFFRHYLLKSGRVQQRRSLLRAVVKKSHRYQRHNEKREAM